MGWGRRHQARPLRAEQGIDHILDVKRGLLSQHARWRMPIVLLTSRRDSGLLLEPPDLQDQASCGRRDGSLRTVVFRETSF
jgi:hypothetical protein